MTMMAASLERYATEHKIEPVPTPDGWQVCAHCGVRVYRVLSQRFQHDPNQLRKLRSAAAREDLDRGIATFAPPEKASPRCESGGYPGCSCDVCF